MLALTRKPGERVVIGDNVIVEVVEVRGDRVKLGFTGPRGIPIRREEVMRTVDVWKAEEEGTR